MAKKPLKPDVYALESIMFIAILLLMIVLNIVQNRSDKSERSIRSK